MIRLQSWNTYSRPWAWWASCNAHDCRQLTSPSKGTSKESLTNDEPHSEVESASARLAPVSPAIAIELLWWISSHHSLTAHYPLQSLVVRVALLTDFAFACWLHCAWMHAPRHCSTAPDVRAHHDSCHHLDHHFFCLMSCTSNGSA